MNANSATFQMLTSVNNLVLLVLASPPLNSEQDSIIFLQQLTAAASYNTSFILVFIQFFIFLIALAH